MNDASLRKITGALLILTPIAFNVFFTLLSMTFEYPDILREPAGDVLRKFDEGGSGLIATWYGFMLTAVLFVPLSILVHRVLARQDTPYMAVATAFGVVAGVVQFLGLVRWPFLVPYLADTYLDPASSEATRESVIGRLRGVQQVRGCRCRREPRLSLHRALDRVRRIGNVRIVAAIQKIAGRSGNGVGCQHLRRDPRTGRVRTGRRHCGSRIHPVVSLARLVRRIRLAHQRPRQPIASGHHGKYSESGSRSPCRGAIVTLATPERPCQN